MAVSLVVAFLALRAGLALRRARRTGEGRAPDLRPRHLRWAKPAVLLVAVGFAGGPLSMVWLRGREAFGTLHAALGAVALLLFAGAALLGRRMERGRAFPRDAHALLGALALLAGLVAAVAGFAILP